MRQVFNIGDQKYHHKIVDKADLANFNAGMVHPVCSTFSLSREMEWVSRLFVLEMLDDDEEGIGTRLEINHISPALEGEQLELIARVKSIIGHEIICDVQVRVANRLIAEGITGQKILKKDKIEDLISKIKKDGRKGE